MAQLSITRFWTSPNAEPYLEPNGFLVDPSRWGLNTSPALETSEQWSGGVTVLLGESGMGKSTAVEQHSGRTNASLFSLKEYGSEERLQQSLVRVLEAGSTELILDGLEESPFHSPNILFSVLQTARTHTSLDVSIRICSRTGFWKAEFQESLAKRLNTSVKVLKLLPLRRSDAAEIVRSNGVPEGAFFEAIQGKSIESFAARPITLLFLVREFLARGELPSSRLELFRAGISQLIGGQDDDDFAGRLARISEIALTMRLCQRTGVSLSRGLSESLPEGLVTISEVPHLSIDRSPNITLPKIATAGVFSGRGQNALGFAHESYGDYLAGSALASSGLRPAQLFDLTTVVVGDERAAIPALEETIGWAATMNQAIAAQFIAIDPWPFLRTDTDGLSDDSQQRLVERLFSRAAQGRLDQVSGLPGLKGLRSEVILPVLRAKADPKTELVERLYLDLLVALGREAAVELRTIVFDETRQLRSRVTAARALRDLKIQEDTDSFRRLALSPAVDDLDDDLKGIALRAVWPSSATLAEVVASLTLPRRGSYFGSYWGFLEQMSLPDTMSAADWEAIGVFLLTRTSPDRASPFLSLRKRFLERLLATFHNDHQRTQLLAQVILQQLKHWNEFLFEEPPDEFPTNGSAIGVVSAILDLDRNVSPYQLARFRPAILIDADVDEYLARAAAHEAVDTAKAERWCNLALQLLGTSDALLEARESFPLLRRLSSWLEPVELGSERAAALREHHKLIRQQLPRNVWGPENDAEVTDRLLRCLQGEQHGWWNLTLALSRDYPQGPFAQIWNYAVFRFTSWNSISGRQRQQILDAALEFVEHGVPGPTTWIDIPDRVGTDACAAFRAFTLLEAANDPHHQPSISAWRKWSCSLVALMRTCLERDGEAEKRVWQRAFEIAPGEARDGLARTCTQSVMTSDNSTWLLTNIRCLPIDQKLSVLREALDCLRNDNEWASVAYELMSHGFPFAFDSIVEAIDFGTTFRSSLAARTLLEICPAEFYPWELLNERDDSWGVSFLLSFANQPHLLDVSCSNLTSAQLGDVVAWLFRCAPPESDPQHDGVHIVDAREELAQLRDQMLNRLGARADKAAIDSILAIRDEAPNRHWIDIYAHQVRSALAGAVWSPPTPSDLKKLIIQSNSRLVRTTDELAALVVDELRCLQEAVNATSLVHTFWNEGDSPSPKNEENLSDRVADWLNDRLKGRDIIVNREVQVRRASRAMGGGRRLDLRVEVGDMLLLIEVKGIWNNGLRRDLRDQLLDRYLAEPGATHGIYLVGWFAGPQYTTRAGFQDVQECQAYFNGEAAALSDLSTKRLDAVVLDLSWPVD